MELQIIGDTKQRQLTLEIGKVVQISLLFHLNKNGQYKFLLRR